MRKVARITGWVVLFSSILSLGGCSGSVGVGLSVGIPIGDHGHVSVGTGRWL
jgi:hypothetical protein